MLKLIYFIFILFVDFETIFAQSSFKATQFISNDGLSQNSVRIIYEDHCGYLWIGTQDGLNKYDGYQFQVFRHNPKDSTSIDNNSITSIYEDENDTLWIGTISGINRLDKRNNTFKSFQFWDVGYIASLPKKLYPEYYKKYLLIATGTGLYLFNKNNGKSRKVLIPSTDNNKFPDLQIYWYAWQTSTSQAILWLATKANGLWRVQFSGLNAIQSTKFSLQINSRFRGFEPEIYNLLLRNDTLWIACKTGLFYLNVKNKKRSIRAWHPDGKADFFSGMSIRSFLIDYQGNYWIGTMKHGLYYYNPSKEKAPQRINDEAIFTIFQDQFHSLWVGTSGAGLFKYNMGKIVFNGYQPFPEEKTNSHRRHIWAIYQDSLGFVWLGTNYGIKIFDQMGKDFKKSVYKKKLIKRLSILQNLQIRAIIPDKRGNIWLGSLEEGLFQYRTFDGKIFHYKHIPSDSFSLAGNIIYKLFVDSDQNLWIGMNITGLSKAIFRDGKIIAFKNYYNFGENNPNKNLWVLDIIETPADSDNFLWLATWQKGLIQFNKITGAIKIFNMKQSNGLNCNYLLSLHYSNQNADSILWIGTYGGGLNRFNLKTHNCKYYTTKQGLANNVIYAILEDDKGNLWLSTDHGLSYFDIKNEKFINYDKNDGLKSIEFNLQAAYKNSSGELFFGGVNGLNYFFPSNSTNSIPPKITIEKITILGKHGKHDLTSPFNQTIHLGYNQNSFQIEFVALHSKNPQKNHYAYQLAGWGNEWISIGYQRKVTFMNLPAGHYDFRVKACNSDGIWNHDGKTVHIIIHPPFWRTHWAFSIYLLLIFSLFYYYHRIKIKEALKIERAKSEERFQVKKNIEFDFHDELGIRITNIIQIANKLKFQKRLVENETKVMIDKILKHAHDLDSELNEFLWEIDSTDTTIEDLIIQLKEYSENFFEEDSIDFQIVNQISNAEKIKLPINWRRNIVKIFKEGMNNILKHSKHCKNVTLSFKLKNDVLHIILTDDGDGFNSAEIKLGKGLKSMQRRVETINAKIAIYSQKGQGTSIHFEGKLS